MDQLIQEIKISHNKKLDLLKHLSHKNWGADRQFLLRQNIMLNKSKMNYGCEAYSSASKTTLVKLNTIQNATLISVAIQNATILSVASFWSVLQFIVAQNLWCRYLFPT